MLECPCDNCTKIKYPHLCENKWCPLWRKWFVENWNAMIEEMRREIDG